ncbi:MAG: L-aspartate oxidase [Pseudanabaenaceae cyanobacterium]
MSSAFDAIVVGSGAAGLYTALCFSERLGQGGRVGLITKGHLRTSASCWAQGGIAAVLDASDTFALHFQDTLRAGAGLCDGAAVAILVREAPRHIQHLLQLGVNFDRNPDGTLALTLEAAHSRHRVLHSADATGKALVETLTDRVLEHPQITVLAATQVIDLVVVAGECRGVWVEREGEVYPLLARATVLATGGGAYVYSQTTNPPSSTGEGVVMAWRRGVQLRDMEFVQFHPTALCFPGAPRFLISEAVRGEGAHLIDSRGRRFLFDYHPQGELAPRDIVSRSVWHYLQETGEKSVFLDLSPIPLATIRRRFPTIARFCQEYHIDIETQPIPVTPAAHYCIGGIATDTIGATSLPGLYAVGEVANTGVHGANRLASNSLLECFVFGERLAKYAPLLDGKLEAVGSPLALELGELDCQEQVREICWRSAGIVRTQASLETGLRQLEALAGQKPNRRSLNLLTYGQLIMQAALYRQESRGTHYRQDFPHPDPQWQQHTIIVNNSLSLTPLTETEPEFPQW